MRTSKGYNSSSRHESLQRIFNQNNLFCETLYVFECVGAGQIGTSTANIRADYSKIETNTAIIWADYSKTRNKIKSYSAKIMGPKLAFYMYIFNEPVFYILQVFTPILPMVKIFLLEAVKTNPPKIQKLAHVVWSDLNGIVVEPPLSSSVHTTSMCDYVPSVFSFSRFVCSCYPPAKLLHYLPYFHKLKKSITITNFKCE